MSPEGVGGDPEEVEGNGLLGWVLGRKRWWKRSRVVRIVA
jgi:hypothetical protein